MAHFGLRLDHFIRAISFIAIVMGCSAEPAYADAALIARGHALAANCCGRCHAIGKTGESANPKSPPLPLSFAQISINSTYRKRSPKASSLATKGWRCHNFNLAPR